MRFAGASPDDTRHGRPGTDADINATAGLVRR